MIQITTLIKKLLDNDEIRLKNEMIARYMGYKRYGEVAWINDNGGYKFVLSYNTCWSELMPVIERIDTLHDRNNGDVYCQTNATIHTFNINYNDGRVIKTFHPKYNKGRNRASHETRIENYFICICDFLEWLTDNELLNQ